jgi:hypothetical protein
MYTTAMYLILDQPCGSSQLLKMLLAGLGLLYSRILELVLIFSTLRSHAHSPLRVRAMTTSQPRSQSKPGVKFATLGP